MLILAYSCKILREIIIIYWIYKKYQSDILIMKQITLPINLFQE